MSLVSIAGQNVDVDGEGFLTDPNAWTPEIAQVLANSVAITLTERHWQVINFCRSDYESTGQSPGVRRITKVGGVPTKEMYQLFPRGPGKLSAKIAGLHKPVGCL